MLQPRHIIPDFTLDSSEGIPVSAAQYRGQRNLVIAFAGDVSGAAMDWLSDLAGRADDIEEENARVLVIVRATPEQARELHQELAAPFVVLADCEGEVHRRFAAQRPGAVVLITDRYGEIYSVHRDALPSPAEVIASLRHINIMCDE